MFYFTSVNRLASHHTSASTLQVFHLETVTSLMWVEKKLFWQFPLNHYWDPSCYLCCGANVGDLVKGNACLYCLNCMKFGQLILREIIKIIATR